MVNAIIIVGVNNISEPLKNPVTPAKTGAHFIDFTGCQLALE